MDKTEAKSILTKELREYAAHPYDKLVLSIKHADVKNVMGESGATTKSRSTYSGIRSPMAISASWLRLTTAAGGRLCRSPIH